MQPTEIVNLELFWNEWSRCLTTTYQRDLLYRFGKFDDCQRQWQDFKTALKAKVATDEERARQLLESTYFSQRTTVSPTADVIWKIKEKPGWTSS